MEKSAHSGLDHEGPNALTLSRHLAKNAQKVASQYLAHAVLGIPPFDQPAGDAWQAGDVLQTYGWRRAETVEIGAQADVVNPSYLHDMVNVI